MEHARLPIAVAIPVSEENLPVVNKLARQVAATRARLVEFRIDHARDPLAIDVDALTRDAKKMGLEVILTCRAADEGGMFNPGNDNRKLEVFGAMVDARPTFIDLELSTPPGTGNTICGRARANDVGIILSKHDFQMTPPADSALDLAREVLDAAEALVPLQEVDRQMGRGSHASPGGHPDLPVLKLVFMARNEGDNVFPLKILECLGEAGYQGICFCMGEKGIFSRVACVIPGRRGVASLFTYASIGEKTAPGQVHVNEMAAMLGHFL